MVGGRIDLAIEQPTPDVPRTNQIELEPPTEAELCTRGAVKLIHIQIAELKLANRFVQAELRSEKQRNDALTASLNSTKTDYQVLQASVGPIKNRDLIVRIIEFVIVVLLAYMVDFLKSGNIKSFIVFMIICLLLGFLVFLIHRTSRPTERK